MHVCVFIYNMFYCTMFVLGSSSWVTEKHMNYAWLTAVAHIRGKKSENPWIDGSSGVFFGEVGMQCLPSSG